MHTLTITVRPRTGDGWPVVAEDRCDIDGLTTRSDGLLRLVLNELSGEAGGNYGTRLGKALFQGKVGDAYLTARASSNDRLRVLLSVEDEVLRALRWERLCSPEGDDWTPLALNQRTPFSQHLPTGADRRFPPVGSADLRALIVVACPAGLEEYRLEPFDVREAVEVARGALEPIPCDLLADGSTPGALGPATLDGLCEQLTAGSYTLLHMICHGRYQSKVGETVIYLTRPEHEVGRGDRTGRVASVATSQLISHLSRLRGGRSLPYLTFLAGCETSRPEAEGALGGMAQGLVRDLGLPAVVAMTDRVSVRTAHDLTRVFYQRLFAHGEVDVALVESFAGLAGRPDVEVPVPAVYSRLGGRPFFSLPGGPEAVDPSSQGRAQVGSTTRSGPTGAPGPRASALVALARLPLTGADLFGREAELRQLNVAWAESHTHIICVIAAGGVGKSALINSWLAGWAGDGYRDATRVFGWSFNAEGNPNQAASVQLFVEAALAWFGDVDPAAGTAWDRGERLAWLVQAERCLLVLDGVEAYLECPGPDGGRLKDPALLALLKSLAAQNAGLCVVTTTVMIADLRPFEGQTVTNLDLRSLTPQEGARLLRTRGVDGDEAELERTADEFGGNGLALTLLGTYLAEALGGDVLRRHEVRLLRKGEHQGDHARRVVAAYERLFSGQTELAVLRLLGQFNRPATPDAIAAVRAEPLIPGVTDDPRRRWRNRFSRLGLVRPAPVPGEDWRRAVARLVRLGLVTEGTGGPTSLLDAHPLVREYFREGLRRASPRACRRAHGRLYEYYARNATHRPDTLEEMGPLYSAIFHGCQAGRYQETLDAVYRNRVQRGERFSLHRLGAAGPGLVAMQGFFRQPWAKPVRGLDAEARAYVSAEAGRFLRAMGRSSEAAEAFQASYRTSLARRDLENAAGRAGNLGVLLMTIGRLSEARSWASRGVDLADRFGDARQRMSKRTALADVLHQEGRIAEAESLFMEAEELQKEIEPDLPFLYAIEGFRLCDLLLAQGKSGEVEDRLKRISEARRQRGPLPSDSLLARALEDLSMGQVLSMTLGRGEPSDPDQDQILFDRAVDGLRRASTFHHLPRGLVARADSHRRRGDSQKAREDLEEARAVAERGEMRLHLANSWIGLARLERDLGRSDQLAAALAQAKRLISDTDCLRREPELQHLQL